MLLRWLSFGVVVAAVLGVAPAVQARTQACSERVDQLIVQPAEPGLRRPSPEVLARWSALAGLELSWLRRASGGTLVLRADRDLNPSGMAAVAERLEADPSVVHAEADLRLWPALTPTDPQYGEQWYLHEAAGGARLPAAWDVTTGSPGIVVAVVDTGVRFDHPDLVDRLLPGYDLISLVAFARDGDQRDPDPSDMGNWSDGSTCAASNSDWHGTHVAGIVAAAASNATGVAGINWASKVLPVRVIGQCGALVSDLMDGIRWAVGMQVGLLPVNPSPADVLNLSLATAGSCPSVLQAAINDARSRGAVVVAGAGNDGADTSGYYPANCTGVIAVGATTRTGSRASYSNTGAAVDLSAPGGSGTGADGILSTSNAGVQGPTVNTYAARQGTSYAAPVVSGVASLVLSVNPNLTPVQVEQILKDTARPFPDSSCNTSLCGAGIVDADAAVQAALATVGTPVVNAGPDQTVETGSAVTLAGSATDDGTIVSYAWTQAAGTGVSLGGAATPTATFTAPATAGTLTFRLAVTDNDSRTGEDFVDVVVVFPNLPPAPTAAPIVTDQDVTGTTQIFHNDPNVGDRHTYGITTPPSHGTAVFNTRGGIFVIYTPAAGFSGSDSLTVTVTDLAGAQGSVVVPVTVNPVGGGNNPPSFTSAPITVATEDQPYSYAVTATDPDAGNTLTITAPVQPTWLTFVDNGGGSATLSGTPTQAQVGSHSVQLAVSDGAGGSATQSFTVTVANVNDPPVLGAVGSRSVTEAQALSFTLAATDPDGPAATFSASPLPAGATLNPATGEFSWTPAYGQEGTYDVTFAVLDGGTPPLSDQETVAITVAPAIVTVGIPLQAGWNLVSFPVAFCAYDGSPPSVALPAGVSCSPVTSSIGEVFAAIVAQMELVRSFDADGYHTYDPALPVYVNDLTYVAAGYGYWIKMKQAATWSVTGRRLPPATTLALQPGWSLVGYWGPDVRHTGPQPTVAFPAGVSFAAVASIADVFPGLGTLQAVWSADVGGDHEFYPGQPAAPSPVTYVGPGYGYWIKVGSAGALGYDLP